MPLSTTALTSLADTDGDASATSASISPTANALIICDVCNIDVDFADAVTPTVSGNGLTWVQVATVNYSPSNIIRLTRFRAMGASPSTGAVTITCSVNQALITASIYEISGVDTSGTNGSGAIAQTVTGTPFVVDTSSVPTITLAAFASASNLAIGALSYGGDAFDTNPGSGFTGLHEIAAAGVNSILATEYKLNDTTVDWTLTAVGAGGYNVGAIASEIKEAPSATAAAGLPHLVASGQGKKSGTRYYSPTGVSVSGAWRDSATDGIVANANSVDDDAFLTANDDDYVYWPGFDNSGDERVEFTWPTSIIKPKAGTSQIVIRVSRLIPWK